MKERTPLCRAQREYVCLHTGSQGVLFGATEAEQDPSGRANDVLCWGPWGGRGPRHSPASGPRCFLPACWKSTNRPVMGQVNHEPCAVAAPAVPFGTSKLGL